MFWMTIMATPDKAIPNQIMSQATCVGVIPSVKKGAFLVGAEYGQGVVTCRTGHGWSAPAFIQDRGRKLRLPDWRPGDRPGAGRRQR